MTSVWQRRSHVPSHVFDVIDSFPSYAHPMTMFVAAVMALQTEGQFVKAYAKGLNKKDYWNPTYDDTMDLIARLPRIAAYVYRRKYKNNEQYSQTDCLIGPAILHTCSVMKMKASKNSCGYI
jgi:citrate synthase